MQIQGYDEVNTTYTECNLFHSGKHLYRVEFDIFHGKSDLSRNEKTIAINVFLEFNFTSS